MPPGLAARSLTAGLIEDLKKTEGVKVWTHQARERSAAIATFRRTSTRLSPHVDNTSTEVDGALAAVAKYVRAGV